MPIKTSLDSLLGWREAAAAGAATAPARGLVSVDGKTFPLKSTEIRARAESGLAESLLVQSFANPHDEPLEVLYTMPLPADGAVVGYTIELGERTITGEIEKVDAARQAYREALAKGHTAGLLEQTRADTFVQSLGNLPAGQSARVELRILHPLAFRPSGAESAACWEYRFPTVVGVRYEGAPGRVEDADKLDVDRADAGGTPVRLGLELVLGDGDATALRPHSPSHAIRSETVEAGTRVGLTDAAALDRDLVVQWRATSDEVELRLVEGPGLAGDDGRYALLSITPPTRAEHTFARDLTILMDASGSMTGPPLESSKELVQALLGSLGPEDRFEILAFASQVGHVVRGPLPATPENVRSALSAVRQIRAGGGTEMTRAMVEALRPLRPDSQRQVVLLTDGYIGFEGEVIGEIVRGLQPGCRLHVVGIGAAPNRTLTHGAARAGRGVELFAGDGEGVAAAAERLLQATVGPVLTDLSIGGSATAAVAPARTRDVLAGQPLVVTLELTRQGGGVEVRGRLAGSDRPWIRSLEVPHSAETRPQGEAVGPPVTSIAIGALFGREAVEDQELRLAASLGPDARVDVDQEIERLGLRHRITTRLTSLVAISEEPTVDPSEPRRRKRIETELPAGVSAEGVGLADQLARFSLRSVPALSAKSTQVTEHRVVCDTAARGVAIPASVVRIEHDLLVVAFESPEDGFELPAGDEPIEVIIGEDWKAVASIDAKSSTRRGPHDAGLVLRLAIRRSDGVPWPREGLLLRWSSASAGEVLVFVRP